jgi:hypothetical protein
MKRQNLKAFSIIEISVAILVIGILVAGITQASRLVGESGLRVARNLTTSSRVASLDGLVFWYEPTLESSFSTTDAVDKAVISAWNDNNPQNVQKLNALAGQKTDSTKATYNLAPSSTAANTGGPTYVRKGINGLPTLRFTNTTNSSYRYLVVDNKMKNNPRDSMTLFAVVRRHSGTGFFIDRACVDSSGAAVTCSLAVTGGSPLFGLNIETAGTLASFIRADSGTFSGLGVSASSYSTGFTIVPERPYIMALQRDYNSTFTTYINGNSKYSGGTPTKVDTGESISLDPYKIGRHSEWDGDSLDTDISEVIFFSGSLSKRDRQLVEDYLGKKYDIKVTH